MISEKNSQLDLLYVMHFEVSNSKRKRYIKKYYLMLLVMHLDLFIFHLQYKALT